MFQLIVLSALLACGLAASIPGVPSEGRIVGGETASISSFPYQASIQIKHYTKYFHTCGGSILNGNTIISAAHCFYPQNGISKHFVRVGSDYTMQGGQFAVVSSVTIHPQYDSGRNDYDVAILKLSSSLQFNQNVQPIALDDGSTNVLGGVYGVISGWGSTQFQGSASYSLQKAIIPIVPQSSCQSSYSRFASITDRMLCAGRGGHDSCQGDSGGPLVVSQRLVGIVSWGYECARPNFPGVYARVSAVRSWINQYV